jgi:endonuclease YncB( thermonuclease family)
MPAIHERLATGVQTVPHESDCHMSSSRRRPESRRPSSQLGSTGLLIIGLVVVLYLVDQQFGWGLFPAGDATPTSQVTRPARTATDAGNTARTAPTGSVGIPAGLPTTAEAATVVSVADGDTISVDLDGEKVSVRLVGIDTPETYVTRTGYKECYGTEASTFAKERLAPGTVVYLERDVTDMDRYDRLLRYVWVDAGSIGAGPTGQAIMFNEVLVEDGFAIPYPYKPDVREQPRFETAAGDAESANRGIWCACGGERIPVEQTTAGCPAPVAVLPLATLPLTG